MDLFDVEAVEAQLDCIVERAAREARDANAIEGAWAERVRLHHARRREENREAWRSFHLDQAARLEAVASELARDHRARAEALLSPGAS